MSHRVLEGLVLLSATRYYLSANRQTKTLRYYMGICVLAVFGVLLALTPHLASAKSTNLAQIPSSRIATASHEATSSRLETITISMADRIVPLNSTVSLPIHIGGLSEDSKLGAVTIQVHYDASVLSAINCLTDPNNLFDSVICNETVPGVIQLTAISLNGQLEDTDVAEILFQSVGNTGEISPLEIQVTTFADLAGSDIEVQVQNAEVSLGSPLGDANCDGSIDAIDALFVMQFDAGNREGSQECPLSQPNTLFVPSCDVDDDTSCGIVDALFVLQCNVGVPNLLCALGVVGGVTSVEPQEEEDIVALDFEPFEVGIGVVPAGATGEVTIPITASVPSVSELGAATLELHYDPLIFQPTRCSADPGDIFDAAICNLEYEDDQSDDDSIRLNIISAEGVTGEIEIVEVTFQVVGTVVEDTTLALNVVEFADASGDSVEINAQEEGSSSAIFLPYIGR